MSRNVGSTGAEQSSDPLLHASGLNSKVVGDECGRLRAPDRTLAGLYLSADYFFSKKPTSGKSTCTAVGSRKQVGDPVNSRIFVDPQFAKGNSDRP